MRKSLLLLVMFFTFISLIGCMEIKNEDNTTDETDSSDEIDDSRGEDYGPPDTTTKWVFQPAFDSSDSGWDSGIVPWIEAVEEATEGTIEMELLSAGSIVSGDEAFGAAADGAIDVYAGWATVYGGQMPEGMLAYGLAMGADNYRDAWAAMWGDPKYKIGDIVQEAANENNLEWVGWTSQGTNSIFTNFPVETMEDLKGKKLRAGGPQAIFLETMGGIPVSFDANEIYTAIDLGTIDGSLWATGNIGANGMKLHEVTDYAMVPGWNASQAQETYVNLDAWNSLNQWQRDQIKSVFESTYFETSRLHAEGEEEALQDMVDSGGEIIELEDDVIEEMREKSIKEIWPKVAEESELTAKGIDLWKEFLSDIGKID